MKNEKIEVMYFMKHNYEVLVFPSSFLKKEEKNFIKFMEIEAENIREASDKFKAMSPIREYLIRPTQKKKIILTIPAL